jgi:hypothetical protein
MNFVARSWCSLKVKPCRLRFLPEGGRHLLKHMKIRHILHLAIWSTALISTVNYFDSVMELRDAVDMSIGVWAMAIGSIAAKLTITTTQNEKAHTNPAHP